MTKEKNSKKYLEKIECSCGCGMLIYKYDKQGRVMKYKTGHQNSKEKTERTIQQWNNISDEYNNWSSLSDLEKENILKYGIDFYK